MTNLGTRTLVALVGIPLIIAVSLAGSLWFLGFVLVVSSLALREFYALGTAKGAQPMKGLGLAFGAVIQLSFFHHRIQSILHDALEASDISIPVPTQFQLLAIILITGVAAISVAEMFRKSGSPILNIGVTVLGVLYVSLFLGALVGLREVFNPLEFPMMRYFPHDSGFMDAGAVGRVYAWGGYTVVTLFASIWICDSAAYFAGLGFGRRKLFPRVSPNKTWEGAVAGFLAAVGVAVVGQNLVLGYLSMGQAAVFGAIVGSFGQVGDLVESWFKRDAGVKDSSSLIPGHGGVFDRFDSLIFVAPIAYLYIDFIVLS